MTACTTLGWAVAEDHGAGTHEVVYVFVAADVPDAGAAAPLDDEGMIRVEGDVAQGPLGEKPGGLLEEKGFFVAGVAHGGLQGLIGGYLSGVFGLVLVHHVHQILNAGGGTVQHGLFFIGEFNFDDLLDAVGTKLDGYTH